MQKQITLESIDKMLQRIDGKLTILLNKPEKKTWLKVSFVTGLTGWNGEKLRQARDSQVLEFRKAETGGYEYLLESIPEKLIKR
jgi:hypothetical protein